MSFRLAVLAALCAGLALSASAQPPSDLDGPALRAALRDAYTPTQTLGYGPARDSLYTYVQRTEGALCGVYTDFCVVLEAGADASTSAFRQGINAEHTWPQSRGAENEPQRSDLHALFPARANVNSSRGNHPFAEIPDPEATAWYRLDQSRSTVPTVAIHEWSERAEGGLSGYAARFEPRESVAGDIARAVAYFAVIYEPVVEAYGERGFLAVMADDLIAWNAQDPPDATEIARSAWIASRQGTDNPFVFDPSLLPRALADYGADAEDPPSQPSDGPLWVNEFHYDDVSTDEGEFIEVAGPAGAALDGWRLVLYNGNGGAAYDDRGLRGTLSDEGLGLGAATFAYPTNGIQNGPDGIALVDPSGAVVQFLAYEGTFVAAGGPADGLTPTLIGVEESNSTREGSSVALTGTGRTASDFVWTVQLASPGALNDGQSIVATPVDAPVAARLSLGLPFPNPTGGAVRMSLSIPAPTLVRAVVVDALGREVAVVLDSIVSQPVMLSTGGVSLAPGAYALRVESGREVVSRWFAVLGSERR